jgi:hypothetical protein
MEGDFVNQQRDSDEEVDKFLLIQFQSLSSHIDALISGGNSRVATFVLVCTIAIAVISGLLKPPLEKQSLFLSLTFVATLLFTGIYFFRQLIFSSIKIVKYFRILNSIRGYFSEKSPIIANVCTSTLPITCDKPNRIKEVFDPGLYLIMVLNNIVFAFLLSLIADAAGIISLEIKVIVFIVTFILFWLFQYFYRKFEEEKI